MKRIRSVVLGAGLLLASCGQQPSAPAQSDVPEAYRDTTGAAWSYTGPTSALPLGISSDNAIFGATVSARSSWGPIELNMSNGEKSAGDGHPLTMAGKVYSYGLGLHAGAEISYSASRLTGVSCQLAAEVGVDAEVGSKGSVSFEVYADGVKLYDSGVLRGGDPAKHLAATLPSAKVLKLVVTNGGDNYYFDHADIANPTISCAPTQAVPALGNGKILVDNAFLINPDGSGKEPFTVQPRNISINGYDIRSSDFVMDGKRIAVIGTKQNSSGQDVTDVFTLNPDGSDIRQVTTGRHLSGATLSPDGAKIAFADADGILACQYSENIGCVTEPVISTMNVDGSGEKVLFADQEFGASRPLWSPDGTQLLFSTTDIKLRFLAHLPPGIWVMNADGGNARAIAGSLLGEYNFNPLWSPSGDRIIFEDVVNRICIEQEIGSVKPDGTGALLLTNYHSYVNIGGYSPDGTRIVFGAAPIIPGTGSNGCSATHGPSQIFTINPDGSDATPVPNTENNSGSVWLRSSK